MPWMYNSLHLYPYISKFKIALVQIIWPLSGIIVVLNEHKFNLDWYQNKYNINIKNYYNSSVPKYILVKILTQFFIQRGSQNYQYYFKYLVRLFSYHLTILQSSLYRDFSDQTIRQALIKYLFLFNFFVLN